MLNRIRNHFARMGRVLRYRNFRLFVGGQNLSLIGTWIQMIAINWLVYKLTSSVVMLGIVNFSSRFPFFIISPFAGMSPFGSLISGLLGNWIGIRATLILCGVLCIAAALIYITKVSKVSIEVRHSVFDF